MLKKFIASLTFTVAITASGQTQGAAQIFQQPGVIFNNSSPFSSGYLSNPFTSSFAPFGGGFAPGLVTGYSPYGMSPLGFGGGSWLTRPIGYGGFGNFGGYGGYGFNGLGAFGGYPFTNGGYGGFGYPAGFANFGGYGGYGYGAFGGYGGYGGIYPGNFGWGGGYGGFGGYGGNPFTGGGLGPGGHELGTLQTSTQVIQTAPSKSSGNYYQPSTVDTTASGSYYADTAPPAQQADPTPRHNGWNSQANWTSPSGDGNFWGSGGNGLPKDLNSVPWNK